ncbi:MAG: hypothetical protein WEA99_06260 [Brumimicrobium sp.]
MKQIIYIFTFLFFGQFCFGQEKNSYVPTYENGDTTLWFNWQQEKFQKAGLKNLSKTTDTLHFRFSSEIQAIDIWTTNFLTFSGTLTNFTKKYAPDARKRKKEKFYSNTKSIDSVTAKQVYDLFIEKAIFEIVPQDNIKEWSSGKDGNIFFIEYVSQNYYSFKDYWSPETFKEKITAAKKINYIAEKLEEMLSLKKSFGQFINSLPNGAYRAGGIEIIMNSNKRGKPNR